MHKILATAFILALTTCYPVHAEALKKEPNGFYNAQTSERIVLEGKILASNLSYNPSNLEEEIYRADSGRNFNLLVAYMGKLFMCEILDLGTIISPSCITRREF